jgi:predicted nucleotidyltransferase
MNENKTSDKVQPKSSIENVRKCLDNSSRLFSDSLNVSEPTKAALIEIAIEELSKTLTLIPKETTKSKMEVLKHSGIFNLIGVTDDKEVPFEKLESIITSRKKISISNFNNHKEKLKAIKEMFEFVSNFYKVLTQNIDLNSVKQFYRQWGDFNVEVILNRLNEVIEKMEKIDIEKWDKIKERGLYVDFKNDSSFSPIESKFEIEDLVSIFFVLHSAIKLVISLPDGKTVSDMITEPDQLIDFLSDGIFKVHKDNSKSDQNS